MRQQSNKEGRLRFLIQVRVHAFGKRQQIFQGSYCVCLSHSYPVLKVSISQHILIYDKERRKGGFFVNAANMGRALTIS